MVPNVHNIRFQEGWKNPPYRQARESSHRMGLGKCIFGFKYGVIYHGYLFVKFQWGLDILSPTIPLFTTGFLHPNRWLANTKL